MRKGTRHTYVLYTPIYIYTHMSIGCIHGKGNNVISLACAFVQTRVYIHTYIRIYVSARNRQDEVMLQSGLKTYVYVYMYTHTYIHTYVSCM